ncbi:FGGY family carbohydrate kinase, partial [Pseudomonas aeruginosa]
DQGTTSSRAIVFDRDANVVSQAQREFAQFYPQAGWVEHDPMEIWATQSSALGEALAQASIQHDQVAAIGITNQRDTTLGVDRRNGGPIPNAIL